MRTRPILASLAVAGLSLAAPRPAFPEAGETGAVLFQQAFGARPLAMGQAYAAIGDDAFAMVYNPATLARLRDSQAATQFTRSIGDTRLGYLALATPLNERQALGLNLAYLDAGKAEIFDDAGISARTVSAQRDLLVQSGYAHAFEGTRGRVNFGVAAKALRSVLAEEMHGTAYAADLGSVLEWRWLGGLFCAGASISNIGPAVSYSGGIADGSQSDPLPLTSRLGLGFVKDVLGSDKISAAIQIDRVLHDDSLFKAFGLEYNYRNVGSLRAGYRLGQDLGNLTFGLGLAFKGVSFDYSMALVQTFENIQHFSLAYRFNIPGIRYAKQPGPDALAALVREAESDIQEDRFFAAAEKLDRLQAGFPNSNEALSLSQRINGEIDSILLAGSGGRDFNYAQAFRHYQQGRWTDALEALESDPTPHPEAGRYADKIRAKLRDQERQERLQQQARNGKLFELATQAYESGDVQRALKIVEEILRVGPYHPAQSLKRRIRSEAHRPMVPAPAPRQAPAQAPVSSRNAALAERYYYEALRNYAKNNIKTAIQNLQEGLRLNPDSEMLKNTLRHLEKEIKSEPQR
ncbi:MAG: PorV/PorQ family protein [Elusimicrobia bacterium]|nr:PorV/PorQ family protein [Elusimicrobiota bacterium]